MALEKLTAITRLLVNEQPLEAKNRDHALVGQPYLHCRECHIEPDWLLVYKISEDTLILVRTGSHSDLFRNY